MGFQSSGNFPGGQAAQDELLRSLAASLALGNMQGTGGFGDIPPGASSQGFPISPIGPSLSVALGKAFIPPAALPLSGQPADQAFQNAAPQAAFQPRGLTPLPGFGELFGRIRLAIKSPASDLFAL